MIRSLLRNGFSIDTLIGLCASAFVVFCTLPIHEYAHALVATKLGDDTPRLSGRLTLNPMAHIDIMGAVMILLVGFGYAKAVPVNPRNFKNPKAGMALTAAAGPLSNVILSYIFVLIGKLVWFFFGASNPDVVAYVYYAFDMAASINVSLAVFNLLPIPPFDGSRIMLVFLKERTYFKLMQYEQYIMIAVLAICWTGVLNAPLNFLDNAVMSFLDFTTSFVPLVPLGA